MNETSLSVVMPVYNESEGVSDVIADVVRHILDVVPTSELVVIGTDGTYIGVISEGDLLRALMPEFERTTTTIENLSITEASRLFVESAPFNATRPIASLLIRKSITLAPNDPLLVAATVMVSKNIRRLPVVQDGRLVGMLARAKIPWTLLRDAGVTAEPEG